MKHSHARTQGSNNEGGDSVRNGKCLALQVKQETSEEEGALLQIQGRESDQNQEGGGDALQHKAQQAAPTPTGNTVTGNKRRHSSVYNNAAATATAAMDKQAEEDSLAGEAVACAHAYTRSHVQMLTCTHTHTQTYSEAHSDTLSLPQTHPDVHIFDAHALTQTNSFLCVSFFLQMLC